MKSTENFMLQAINLAEKSKGANYPNPKVGAVIVKDKKIIATGYHKAYGGDHAEINAINNSSLDLEGTTLYVTLEPCTHHGKTPPCVDALINSGIREVNIAILDPNTNVSGNGLKKLKESGIKVSVGLLENEANEQNFAYLNAIHKKRPFVVAKFASSLDGKIATKTGESKWITNQESRHHSKTLRNKYQAILVGINTIIDDDPTLDAHGNNPIRVILDSKLRINLKSKVLRDNNAIVFTTDKAPTEKQLKLQKIGIRVISLGESIDVDSVLSKLHQFGIYSVFVEGGNKVLGSFFDSGNVDLIYAFIAPKIIGSDKSLSAIGGSGINKIDAAKKFRLLEYKSFGNDLFAVYEAALEL